MRYRELATRPMAKWAIVAVGARLPVAMATLALVFLVRDRPGGYALGAGIAAVYVLGEVVGASVFGPRLKPDRVRKQLAVGLALGGSSFAVLGFLPGAPLPVLGIFAALAGAAPAAAPGGLRTLLTSQLPDALVVTALSAESILTFVVWTASPALTVVLALSVSPSAPLLLAAALMVAAAAGLWALPAGWEPDGDDHDGVSKGRTLARAWPIFVTGAAAASLFALVELTLPALLEQRAIHVGWAGPMLAGFSIAAILGATLYGARGSWPGSVRAQSMVLLLGATACVTLVATAGSLPWIAVSLVMAGLFQSGVQLTRNLSLRAALPARAHAAGYSVLYAATGVGYAGSAILAGTVQRAASPEVAILAGAALTLLLTAVSALAEFAPRWRAPVRRSVNPVIDGRECASEPRLRPGRRPRAATSSRWGLPSAWASG
jgi:MFS family permease